MIKNIILALLLPLSLSGFAQPAPSAPPSPPTLAPAVATDPAPAPETLTPAPRHEIVTAGFYYYCDRTKAYYPAVTSCPEGWIAIPVGPPPAMPERTWSEPSPREAQETVESRPNAMTMELSGRALEYSLNFDRAVSSHLTLGAGISSWQMSSWWWDYQATVTVVPVYAHYYFSERARRAYLTLGADWISVSHSGYSNDTFTNNGAAAVVGGGYEYRDSSGFLMRLTAYVIAGRSVLVNPGVSFGYAF